MTIARESPVPPSPSAPPTPFDRLWLSEAIRLREIHAGPLEDAEANRLARRSGGSLAARIEQRALWLARRDGLFEALQHWKQGARLAAGLLVLLALLSGAGLARGALGDGQQPVNLIWALGGLLGLNLLTLLGWLLGLAFSGDSGSALGRLWLWLSEKLARNAHATLLGPALFGLLQQHRLGRWLLGLGVHGLWSLILASALLMLLGLLATRRYGFIWETTILGDQAFVGLIQAIGWLPAQLGFALPSEAQIRASGLRTGDLDGLRQVWAGWLVGALLVWGLLPRLLLAGFCAWRWRCGRAGLALDPALPAHRLLAERLQPPSERLGVSDPAPSQLYAATGATPANRGEGAVLVGIELDDRRPWPPPLPPGVQDAGVLDDRHQRRQLLEVLAERPATRLLVVCDPQRSPDRGTRALIGELARSAEACRVWLLPAPPGHAADAARLAAWREALTDLGLAEAEAEADALAWLENGHD